MSETEDYPDGCVGILFFGLAGSVLGLGIGLLCLGFVKALGLMILLGLVGCIVGFPLGNYLGR